jgi:hypothetical protein
LQAQSSLFSATQQQIQAQAQLDEDVVALYTALGGGWRETQQQVAPPPVDQPPALAPAALDAMADPAK